MAAPPRLHTAEELGLSVSYAKPCSLMGLVNIVGDQDVPKPLEVMPFPRPLFYGLLVPLYIIPEETASAIPFLNYVCVKIRRKCKNTQHV